MAEAIDTGGSPAPRLSEIETLAADVRLTDRSYWAALDVHDDLEHSARIPQMDQVNRPESRGNAGETADSSFHPSRPSGFGHLIQRKRLIYWRKLVHGASRTPIYLGNPGSVVRAAHDDYLHALERFIEAPVVSGRDLTVKIAVATDLLRAGDSKRALGLLSAMLADVQLMNLAARRDAERRSDEAAAHQGAQSGAEAADEPVPIPAG